MSSPSALSSFSSVALSSNINIDALIYGVKWGGALGTGANLTYSFPWTSSESAMFSGLNGTGSYSEINEPGAASHGGLTAAQQVTMRDVLQSWANVANLTFSEVAETSSNVGDIRIAWTSAEYPGGVEAAGWASIPGAGPASGDIWLNSKYGTSFFSFGLLSHEFAHALGFKHADEGPNVLPSSLDDNQYSCMATSFAHGLYASTWKNSSGQGWSSYFVLPETPMVLDVAAVQYLYGANTTYHSGNDTYTFDPTTPFFKTIWDAAGTDTLSASNFTLPCRIDLTPGSYSSLKFPSPSISGTGATYDGTENLGIAYGCIIENAEGGSGGDVFIGNAANNQFRGNVGDDVLDGGVGIDVALFSSIRGKYVLSNIGTSFSVSETKGTDGTDTLTSIERLQFADKKIALDLTPEGHAGQAMEFIGAVAPDLLNNTSIRGLIISLFDQGQTMESLAPLALDQNLLPTTSNVALANAVYHNVLNGPASTEMTDALVGYIEDHSQANFLATVAGLHINVDLVGLQQSGVEYLI